jgi:hypothetical protein
LSWKNDPRSQYPIEPPKKQILKSTPAMENEFENFPLFLKAAVSGVLEFKPRQQRSLGIVS